LGIGNNILKNKSLNYGVFHYFGDRNFVFFLEQLLSFIFIIVPILEVGFYVSQCFPSEKATVFSIISHLDNACIDVAVRFCDESFTRRIIMYLSNQFVENLGAVQAT
jgi:hypothetical protein